MKQEAIDKIITIVISIIGWETGQWIGGLILN